MRITALEADLSETSKPILSLYLQAIPKNSAGRKSGAGHLAWLKKEGKTLAARLLPSERIAFQAQFDRVEKFLRNSVSGNGALAVFSGPAKWAYVPLPGPVANELRWGKPAISQLRRVAQEQRKAFIIAVDRAGARFFRYELAKLVETPALNFEVDVSHWRRKEHGHMARRDTRMPHGPLRDAFKRRLEEQYQRFFRHIAERIKFISAKDHRAPVFLVGSKRLTKPILSALTRELQDRAVLIELDLARVPRAKFQQKLAPKIAESISRSSAERAKRLVESERGAVLGLDETLAELQNGRIRTVLMVRGFDSPLRQCLNCGTLNRSADPSCMVCGGPRRNVMLSQVLDRLAKEHQVDVEVLDPGAARKLAKAGGIGGWSRPSLAAAR